MIRLFYILLPIAFALFSHAVFAQNAPSKVKSPQSQVIDKKASEPVSAETTERTFREELLAGSETDSDSTLQIPKLQIQPLFILDPNFFKYNTTWSNPEHRCYEFRKPLPNRVDFLFNFLSEQKYHP